MYTYESYGKQVRVIGSDGETTQLLQTFEPDASSIETANILTVESDQTVQSTAGNQTFKTLEAAKQAAGSGDIIRFSSGTHSDPKTVNESITTPVTIVAEPDTVFSCDKTKVNLKIENATMSKQSAFIKTDSCGYQSVTVPAPKLSGGSVDVLAGGTDKQDSNTQTNPTTPDTTVISDTRPDATKGTVATVRVNTISEYESIKVRTQVGSKTFTEPGVYDIEIYGYNATISGVDSDGKTTQIDTIIAEEQQQTTTKDKTRSGESVNNTRQTPVSTYVVESDGSSTVSQDSSQSIEYVDTLKEADTMASDGDLIKLESGTHFDPDTVSVSLNTNITLAMGEEVEMSCKKEKISLSLNEASISDQSQFPDVFCSEYNSVTEETVTTTLEVSKYNIPNSFKYNRDIYADMSYPYIEANSNGGLFITGQDTDKVFRSTTLGSDGEKIQSKSGDASSFSVVSSDVGPNGTVYFASSGYDVAKYSSAGSQLWKRTVSAGSSQTANDIVVSESGSIYVTGYVYEDGSRSYHTAKYNNTGSLLWQDTYQTGYAAEAISIGDDGSVYITGESNSGGTLKVHTVKYHSNGTVSWNSTLQDGSGTDVSRQFNDRIYVSGTNKVGNNDMQVTAYTTDGSIIWSNSIDTGVREFGKAVAIDKAGNAYVAGDYRLSGGNWGILISKVSSDGTEGWSQKTEKDSSGQDVRDIEYTSSGRIYVSERIRVYEFVGK